MTEEELKNIEQTTALLVENGLVIKNTDNFIREIGNTNLNDIINKLNDLENTLKINTLYNKIKEISKNTTDKETKKELENLI